MFVPSVADHANKSSSTVMIHITCDEYLPVIMVPITNIFTIYYKLPAPATKDGEER